MLTVRDRRSHIADHIASVGHGSVATLAERFQVTPETIRRDLTYLEKQGLVARVHGGAVATTTITADETSFWHNEHSHAEEKLAIARAAVELLPDGPASILIDSGTTTAAFAEALIQAHRGQRWTIVTNSLPAGAALAAAGFSGVNLVGGTIKAFTQAVVGEEAVASLSKLRADFVFFGTNGISADHGLSTPDPTEASMKRAMVAAGTTKVLLSDSSKLGQDYLVTFADLDDIDVLVTDNRLSAADHQLCAAHDIKVITS